MWGTLRNGARLAAAAAAAAKPPPWRGLHCSGLLCGSRNLLRKFLSKKKKKFWYESPTLSSHLVQKPSSLANILKLAPPKASLTSDFSICRIYWRTTGNIEQDDHIEKSLQKSAPRIRHLLITHQILGNVPSIVFVRDKQDAAMREIESLLATADMGPEEEDIGLVPNNFSEQRSTVADMYLDSHSAVHTNLFGIDHEALNKQILEYKKMKKDKEAEGIGLSEQQQQQLAEIRKQKKMRWKKTKKPFDDDITPQKYLMDKYSEPCWDYEVAFSQDNQLEHDSGETESELEVDRTTKLK
ncbi:putative ribosome-binding factor A, mitochondrial isoform X2 [Sceloporus undulatus]|uniref:putative ribosome-binding factor A, mitochondrial isoform X2 n=1 Tax=Sceloporus undulatus TaxID=8520 RepID=UPI001C4A9236|nr:putative ribosome-binding factor A, mitochondrial isoform X2 [Sceloporus undulatus]